MMGVLANETRSPAGANLSPNDSVEKERHRLADGAFLTNALTEQLITLRSAK
jgi:hypothetical protein